MRKIFCLTFLLFILFNINPQDNYKELLNEHEVLLNDYEELLNDYEELLNNYKILNNDYIELLKKFYNLNEEHYIDVNYHTQNSLTLNASKKVIEELENTIKYLYSLENSKLNTIFIKGGFNGTYPLISLSFSIKIPNIPFSFIFDVGYNNSISFQAGLGVQF